MECRDCESKDRKTMSKENRVRVGLHWRQCVGPEAGVRGRKGAETRREADAF